MERIRSILSEDLVNCAKLYAEVFDSEPWNDGWTEETAYQRLNDIYRSPNFYGLLYEEGETIKGAVFGNREQWYEGMHYNLREMFVANGERGRGIGRILFEELEKKLQQNDVRTIILFTSKGNRTNAFYQKNGFLDFEDMVMMGKDL